MASESPLNFLVVGDWGRKGLFNQSQVAAQLGMIAEKLQIAFVISTGDNFYEDGLNSTHDPSFEQSFSAIYGSASLQKPWHLVLGNHDYRGDTLAQLDPALKSRDSRWNCYRTSILKKNLPLSCKGPKCPFIHFFFTDTTPFVDQYWNSIEHQYDWRGVLPRKRYLKKQLENTPLRIFSDPLPMHPKDGRIDPNGSNKGIAIGTNDHEASTSSNSQVAPPLDGRQQTKIVGLVELDTEPHINIATRTKDYSSQPIPIYLTISDDIRETLGKPVGAYDLINDLTKTFSHISFLDLLKNSPTHRATLLEALGLGHLINVTPPPEA
ncbi:hypothetical protein KI387_015947 [Taxus chinensis]|uniref:Calcineurin-like phosphoesterase domain-containing protein n=1 Tax=Taxus chinensis TaxID=29808 RepID=A0AA38GGP5_TAXCH|nr:hypothetical protein KI387_015947 [Taxus chinensis]